MAWADSSPLFAAAAAGHADAARLLLDATPELARVPNPAGRTPLFAAAMSGSLELVELLLRGGKQDLDVADKWGASPITAAARAGHVRVVQALLESGARSVGAVEAAEEAHRPECIALVRQHAAGKALA